VVFEALAADQHERQLPRGPFAEPAADVPEQGGVVAAAEAAVAAHHEEVDATLFTAGEERMAVGLDSGRHGREHLRELSGLGTRPFRGFLRAAELRCRDHLHRLRDLLRRAYRRDPLAEGL